jgi:hypothetical protein
VRLSPGAPYVIPPFLSRTVPNANAAAEDQGNQ